MRALALVTVVAAGAFGCQQSCGYCASDADCGNGFVCTTPDRVCAPPSPVEGEAGEGEGEGEGEGAAAAALVVVDFVGNVGGTIVFPDIAQVDAVSVQGASPCTFAAAADHVGVLIDCGTAPNRVGDVVSTVLVNGTLVRAVRIRFVPGGWASLHFGTRTHVNLVDAAVADIVADDPLFIPASVLPAGALPNARLFDDDGNEITAEFDAGGAWTNIPLSHALWVYSEPAAGFGVAELTRQPPRFGPLAWHFGTDDSDASHNAGGAFDEALGASASAELTLGPGIAGTALRVDSVATAAVTTGVNGAGGSVSAWINPDRLSGSQMIVYAADAAATGGGHSIHELDLELDDAALCASVAAAGAPLCGTTPVTLGWHHVAVTWNNASASPVLYLDGVVDPGSGAAPAAPAAGYSDATVALGGIASAPFAGLIDEVRTGATPRTAGQILLEVHMLTNPLVPGKRRPVEGLRLVEGFAVQVEAVADAQAPGTFSGAIQHAMPAELEGRPCTVAAFTTTSTGNTHSEVHAGFGLESGANNAWTPAAEIDPLAAVSRSMVAMATSGVCSSAAPIVLSSHVSGAVAAVFAVFAGQGANEVASMTFSTNPASISLANTLPGQDVLFGVVADSPGASLTFGGDALADITLEGGPTLDLFRFRADPSLPPIAATPGTATDVLEMSALTVGP